MILPMLPLSKWASACVCVQGRIGVKGVIRDRAEAEAKTKQEQFLDTSDLSKWMKRSCLTGENVEGR
jgi:hypothetical protein